MRDLPGAGHAGPFWGRGDPHPTVIARIIVRAGCSWSEFLEFDEPIQNAIWAEIGGEVVHESAVSPVGTVASARPNVVKASSASFADMTRKVVPR